MNKQILLGISIGLCLAVQAPAVDNTVSVSEINQLLAKEKRDKIAQSLALDDKTAAVFWPLYDQVQHAFAPWNERRDNLVAAYGQNYERLTDAQAQSLIQEMLTIERGYVDVKVVFLPKFLKALPGKLTARYFQEEYRWQTSISHASQQVIPAVPASPKK